MSGGKRKGQGDPGAAMAYLRRLHGDPDNAPVGDLAELAGASAGLVCLDPSFNSTRFYSAPRADMT